MLTSLSVRCVNLTYFLVSSLRLNVRLVSLVTSLIATYWKKKIHQMNPQTYKVMSLDTKLKPQTAINCNLWSKRKQDLHRKLFSTFVLFWQNDRTPWLPFFNILTFRTYFSGESWVYFILLVSYSLLQPGFLSVTLLILTSLWNVWSTSFSWYPIAWYSLAFSLSLC